MDDITPFLTYGIALAIAVAIPGPGIAALIGQSLGGGFRKSLAFIAGITLGDIVYLTVAVAGLTALIHVFEGAFIAIKLLAAAYLIYLAHKFWTSTPEATRLRGTQTQSGIAAFMAGFFVTLGNPKAVVFYLALLPTVLDLDAVSLSRWGLMVCVTVVVLFATLILYAAMASNARRFLTQPSALARLNMTAASVIGATAVFMIGQVLVSAI